MLAGIFPSNSVHFESVNDGLNEGDAVVHDALDARGWQAPTMEEKWGKLEVKKWANLSRLDRLTMAI